MAELSDDPYSKFMWRYRRAQALKALGYTSEALREIEEILAPIKSIRGPNHPNSFAARYLQADALRGLQRFEEASSIVEKYLPLQTFALGDGHPDVFAMKLLRSEVFGRSEKFQEAIDLLPDGSPDLLPDHPHVLIAHYFPCSVAIQSGGLWSKRT